MKYWASASKRRWWPAVRRAGQLATSHAPGLFQVPREGHEVAMQEKAKQASIFTLYLADLRMGVAQLEQFAAVGELLDKQVGMLTEGEKFNQVLLDYCRNCLKAMKTTVEAAQASVEVTESTLAVLDGLGTGKELDLDALEGLLTSMGIDKDLLG